MPKNKISDPITDQEMAFARLVLSGAMTDRHAAEAVGLNPDSAAYTKSKPHVRAYMLEHRAAVQQQLVQQEAEGLHRLNLDREQVLGRLWEIANLSPEMTRGSITGQVKALSMIVAMQGLIPDRRAGAAEKKSPPALAPQISAAACPPRPAVGRAPHPATTIDPQPSPAPPVPACRGAQQEDEPGVPDPKLAPSPVADPPPHPGPSQSTFANRLTPSQAHAPYVPLFNSVPDLGVPFSIKNPFVHPR
ncbi:MAG TPA: hypothetical protein VFE27_07190 [Acidobacteriaceae bacterium]|nr:hypothetical protein [Acidobacteriaceae bacterium]